MKRIQYYLMAVLLWSIAYHGFSQTDSSSASPPQKSRHPLVDTVYYPNELYVNVSPVIGLFTAGFAPVPLFSAGYARNFKNKHFLRAGIQWTLQIRDEAFGALQMPSPNSTGPDTLVSNLKIGSFNATISRPAVFIGYEYLIGRRRARFLIGADLFAGYAVVRQSGQSGEYKATYIRDTVTGIYDAEIKHLSSFTYASTQHVFHLGIAPRIGIRYEASRRVALTAVFRPVLYMDLPAIQWMNGAQYSYEVGFYASPLVGDIGLIIKL